MAGIINKKGLNEEVPHTDITLISAKKLGKVNVLYIKAIAEYVKRDKSAQEAIIEAIEAIPSFKELPFKDSFIETVKAVNKKNNSTSANEGDSGDVSNPNDKLLKSYASKLKGFDICDEYINEKLYDTNDPKEQEMLNNCKNEIDQKRNDLTKKMKEALSNEEFKHIMEELKKSMQIMSLKHHNEKLDENEEFRYI